MHGIEAKSVAMLEYSGSGMTHLKINNLFKNKKSMFYSYFYMSVFNTVLFHPISVLFSYSFIVTVWCSKINYLPTNYRSMIQPKIRFLYFLEVLKMIYVQKEIQTNQSSLRKMKFKRGI